MRLIRPTIRSLAAALAVVATASLLTFAPPAVTAHAGTVPSAIRPAADLSQFRAGNIISDAVFTNSSTMNENDIQRFLQARVSTCRSGYTCLKDFRQNTSNKSADRYCNGYTGWAAEPAANIIVNVARSCGINPQVLIVMLQKEQGLVTDTWPVAGQYAAAMGQACPDTAPCDPGFAGFFAQVYGAARQMKIYLEGVYFTWYAPGRTWNILYNPNTGCGSSPVYIENAATSALYYYTPYQPNAAALAAGYGTGDGCSAYGNRNFYNYFTDWFGSTQGIAVSGTIASVWSANGGAAGWIGSPTAAMVTYDGVGWSQSFANADIYVRIGQYGMIVGGAVRAEYRYVGGARGGLGWPTSNNVPVLGGAYQDFTGGRMYVRPDGRAYSLSGEMYAAHESVNNISGILGWPKGRSYQTAEGWRQDFDSGSILQSSVVAAPLSTEFVSLYDRVGGFGQFGAVQTGIVADQPGSHVAFAGGWLQKSANGVIFVKGPLGRAYIRQGGSSGPLGYPTGSEQPLPSGVWTQSFSGGAEYDTGRGVYAVTGFAAALAALGGPDAFGYPSADQITVDQRSWQPFGAVSLGKATPSGKSYVVRGAIGAAYAAAGAIQSFLGAPTSGEAGINGGWTQEFEGGRIYCSGYGTYLSPSSVTAIHDQRGGTAGRLGWPLSAPAVGTGTASQIFSGGGIFVSSAGAFVAQGSLGAEYIRRGAERSSLGWPIGNETLSAGLWSQQFQHGTLVLNPDGTFQVR